LDSYVIILEVHPLTLLSAYLRMYEQPEAIGFALGFGGHLMPDKITLGGLEMKADKLSKVDFLTLCACGTSLNASRYAEKLMKHMGSFDVVHSIDAAEIETSDFPQNPSAAARSAFLVVSQSGETKDVARVVQAAQEKDVTVLSVVNAVGSLIARMTKLGVYCNAGRENAVASTKAFTTQVTVFSTTDVDSSHRNSIVADLQPFSIRRPKIQCRV
jgi:glucosamine--fructose-6-phosphate aminotransferase (isomerizing)